jgi:hypothetical protein
MTFRNADRVRDTSTTTGSGNILVSANPPSSYITFSAIPSIAVNDTFFYGIANQAANEYETGLGTWLGSNTFARTSVFQSSNGNALVNFSAGTKDVFCALPSSQAGFTGIPLVGGAAQTANYTSVWSDQGQMVVMNGSGLTYTIAANASVPYVVGTVLTVVNIYAGNLSIAINSDTLSLAGTALTGSRTLAQNGIATALKVTSTGWLISGTGLT